MQPHLQPGKADTWDNRHWPGWNPTTHFNMKAQPAPCTPTSTRSAPDILKARSQEDLEEECGQDGGEPVFHEQRSSTQLHKHGVGQCAAAWSVRGNPRVKAAFEAIWGASTGLISSMDNIYIWRPWWLQPPEDLPWKPHPLRPHIAQNPIRKPGFHCVQGAVPLYEESEYTGGVSVVPGSHSSRIQERHRVKYMLRLNRGHKYPQP